MSFRLMLVEGLRVQCPGCGSIRRVPRKDSPACLQVGDENVLSQMDLQTRSGRRGWNLFHIKASCASCAALYFNCQADPQKLPSACESVLHRPSKELFMKVIKKRKIQINYFKIFLVPLIVKYIIKM